jgi:cbb3-type cytochrome oxidase maturation protein
MLIPAALFLGLLGLGGFLWALKSGQFDDLDGAANRILFDDDEMAPPVDAASNPPERTAAPRPKDGGHG